MAEGRVQRRLAAILAADVVGYSRLIEADEEGTRARLRSLQIELINPRIAADGGRIVKTMGDGVLVEYPSAVDAVRNALSIQGAMRRRNADVVGENKIEIRVGINVGDVIIEGDDIHGDGVNVAARLEGLCEPGEVYVSGTVYDQVDGKLEATFKDLGEQTVKNIAKPVRVYRANDKAETASSSELQQIDESVVSDKPSIAVLPFENLSNDPEQEYFSDGMAEDLITDISQISGLAVAARNSSFALKGQTLDVKEIATKLGVQHIVEGSVRKMGERLRVNAQLIDGANGQHIWAARYDGNMAEIFDFQDDIREQIVSALKVSLSPADKALAERKSTSSVEAYDLFLRGRASLYRLSLDSLLEAINCLEEAIRIDPKYGDAYGYLSFCLFLGYAFLFPGFDDGLDRAYEIAAKGVQVDGSSSTALMRHAWNLTFMRRHDQSIASFEEAIALAPHDAELHATFGQCLNYWGDPERGLEMLNKGFSMDPSHPPAWEFQLAHSYLLLGRLDEALATYRFVIGRLPKFVPCYLFMASTCVELDRLDDARDAIRSAIEINPRYNLKEAERIWTIYRNAEMNGRFIDNLRRAGLPEE